MQQCVRGLKTVTHLKGYIALNFWFCFSVSTYLHGQLCRSAANDGAISDVNSKKKKIFGLNLDSM